MFGWLLLALLVAYVVRYFVAKRARERFCGGRCVAIALKLDPKARGGWRHGVALLDGDLLVWRGHNRIRAGADLTLRRVNLVVREHRRVRKGEPFLNELCELVDARYQGEPVLLSVLATQLDEFLAWADSTA